MININNKRKVIFIYLGIIIIITIIAAYFKTNNTTYAFQEDNYSDEYVLNPAWVEYTNLSNEEQAAYEVIPEQFIYQYKKSNNKTTNLFRTSSNYPEYYNLRDEGYTTSPDYQGSLGICWAFAATNSMESYLLKNGISNINNPIKFSVRQLDYASVDKDNLTEGFNPYYIFGRSYIGSGAKFNTAFILMSSGISPVTTDKFADSITDTSKKSIGEAINLDNVEYVIDSYVNYGVVGDYTSTEERESWIKEIKEHLFNYGAVAVAVKGSSVYSAGSCIHVNADRTNFLVNQNGECNETDKIRHAMTIIGYDDNYTYEYCRLSSSTTNDLTNCDNIVSGKGAFILKNSWGDAYPYPYLAYTSNVEGIYGVTGVSLKNWDNNYDTTKTNVSSYAYKLSTVTYYKSKKFSEKLKKISFYSNSSSDTDYQIHISANGVEDYTQIGTVTTNKIGLNSFYIDKDILLESDKFSIKITSADGYVDKIYAFTEYVNKTEEIQIDTVIKDQKEYEFNTSELSIYSITKNIPNGALIEYKLLDSNGKDITNILNTTKNYNLNYQVKPSIEVTSTMPSGTLTLKTIYNNQELDSDTIEVSALQNLWSGGSGTIDDPYLIDSIEDFKKIYTSEDYLSVNYKLINDLDFSQITDWNAGKISDYQAFSGTLDGNNHMILGITASSSIPSIFYSLNQATIKNLIFSESTLNFKESGWGNLVSIMAYDSTLENIVITKTVEINGDASYAGGLVGTAYNTDFTHIASYATINTNYAYNGKAAGIVNEGYGVYINECYNYGDITADKSIAAGIAGKLNNNNIRNSLVKNSYNFGNITSSLRGGGLVGEAENSIIENTYNIFSKTVENNIGNIIGTSSNVGIKNSFYYEKYGSLLVEDKNQSTTKINVMSKDKEQLKEENTYLNFDFNNIWQINSGDYPTLKNFNYHYITNIEVDKEINLKVGEEKELTLSFSPISASNKKIRYEILNNDLIKINNNVITALKKGNTILKVHTLDGSNITKEIPIEIILDEVNLEDYEVIENNYLKIGENYNIDNFKNSIYQGNKYKIEISSKNPFIGIGDKISIYNNNNTLNQEYTAIILGDITGSGTVDIGDVAKLYQHIRGAIDMEKEFKLAGDVYKDSKLELNDVAKLYQYVRKGIEKLEG